MNKDYGQFPRLYNPSSSPYRLLLLLLFAPRGTNTATLPQQTTLSKAHAAAREQEHRDRADARRIEHQVVELVVSMDDRRRRRLRQMRSQPLLDLLHHRQRAGVRNRPLELIGPSFELALEITLGAAEALEAGCSPIDFLPLRDHLAHMPADR